MAPMDPGGTKRRCTARRTNGEPCKNAPMRGGLVCRKHGGGTPQARAGASLRLAEQSIRRELAQIGVASVDDPFTELSRLAGEVVSFKNRLAEKVNELTALRYEASGAGTEQLRSEVVLFERALDRCAAVLGMITKLGIDERMARVSERQAEAMKRALDAALAAAGLSGPAAVEARRVIARELRAAS